MSELEQKIRNRLSELDAKASVFAKNLFTDAEIAIDADRVVNTVSVIKLPIMVQAFREADAGRLNLDERYSVQEADMRSRLPRTPVEREAMLIWQSWFCRSRHSATV